MNPPSKRTALLLMLLSLCVARAGASDKSEYDRRAAARYVTLFHSLDRDADGTVTRAEAKGNLNFVPHFDDMDINRDRIVSKDELSRYIEKNHGVQALTALK